MTESKVQVPTPRLNTETEGSTVFMNPRPWAVYSVLGEVRALLRAQGFINTIDPAAVGRGI